jgi:DNA-binding transcriptional ArsR family regulator
MAQKHIAITRYPVAPPSVIADQEPRADQIAGLLRALGHPLRLRLVAALVEGEATVGALTARLGSEQPAISQQLRILRMSGLVKVRRAGGFAHYLLGVPGLPALLECLESCHA